MAIADLNVRGGVNGQQVAIVADDDGCEASRRPRPARGGCASARSRARSAASARARRGAAARTLGTGLPFLVTSANAPGDRQRRRRTPTAYLTNGTPYQSALATVHWLAYRDRAEALRRDRGRSRVALPRPAGAGAVGAGARSRSRSRRCRPGPPTGARPSKAALAGDPDTVYWAGSAAGGGSLLAALRDAGYEGAFVASEESESPEFLAAAGEAAEGAFVIAPASPQNLPEAADWAARFEKRFGHAPGRDALQAYEGVRALAHAVTQSGKVDAERNSEELAVLDEGYTTFLGGPALHVRVRPHDQVRQQHRAEGRAAARSWSRTRCARSR